MLDLRVLPQPDSRLDARDRAPQAQRPEAQHVAREALEALVPRRVHLLRDIALAQRPHVPLRDPSHVARVRAVQQDAPDTQRAQLRERPRKRRRLHRMGRHPRELAHVRETHRRVRLRNARPHELVVPLDGERRQRARDVLQREHGLDAAVHAVAGDAADVHNFDPRPEAPQKLVERPGLPPDASQPELAKLRETKNPLLKGRRDLSVVHGHV